MDDQPPGYLQGNVEGWQAEAVNYVDAAERAWASEEARWGIWQIPDSEVGLLPADMSGMKAIEIGCGTAYVAAWMCRRGAEVAAVDPTPNQLATATRLRNEYQLDIDLRQGYGERLEFDDETFDFAISEYGAALWADPYQWVPEAARVLKPGGVLAFVSNSPLSVMCMPAYDADGPTRAELLRPYFGMHATRWPDMPNQTEFHLPHGKWIELFRGLGLRVERLVELRAPEGSASRYPWASSEWAHQWPSEEAWVVSKE